MQTDLDFADRDKARQAFPLISTLALWEIVSVTSSALIAVWAVLALTGGSRVMMAVPITLAVGFIICSHRLHGESAHDLGWRTDNFLQAMRLLVLPMLIATGVMVSIGWYLGSLRFALPVNRWAILWMPVLGVAWGLLQQALLQGFIHRRAQMVWGQRPLSIFVVAVIFALIHLPNPWLALATFVGGIIWSRVYQRAPNLLALGISHGLMTWAVITTVPQIALHGLRVGFKYFG
jgi:membrane protease YdiL (CAAX protease family)